MKIFYAHATQEQKCCYLWHRRLIGRRCSNAAVVDVIQDVPLIELSVDDYVTPVTRFLQTRFLASGMAGKITGVAIDVTSGTTAALNYRVSQQ